MIVFIDYTPIIQFFHLCFWKWAATPTSAISSQVCLHINLLNCGVYLMLKHNG